MSHLSLRTKDLQFERSKVRHGGVHNFEGFTKSPTAAERALLYKGSPSTSHIFGHSTALDNKTFLQEQDDNFDSSTKNGRKLSRLELFHLEQGEKEIIRRCIINKKRRNAGDPVSTNDHEALQDIILQYEHRASTALHSHDYNKAIECGRHIIRIVTRIYGNADPLCIYGGIILGEAYFLQGDLDKAKRYLCAAEKRLENVDGKNSAQTLRCAISCYTKMGDIFFKESLESTSSTSNSNVKSNKKKVNNRKVRFKNMDFAADAYKHAAHMLDEQGGDSTYCHTRLGHLYIEMGQFVAATTSYECALASAMHFARTIHDANVLLCQKQLADSLLLRNRFANALEHFLVCFEALDNVCKTIPRRSDEGYDRYMYSEYEMLSFRTRSSIALNVATCLRAVGRFTQALDVLENVESDLKMINVSVNNHNECLSPITEDNVNDNIKINQSKPINVLHELNDLKSDGSYNNNMIIYIRCLENLGHTYTSYGNYEEAEFQYERAMEMVDALEDSEFAMNHRSIIYCSKGDIKVHEVFDERPTPFMMMAEDGNNNRNSIQQVYHSNNKLSSSFSFSEMHDDKIPSIMNMEKSVTVDSSNDIDITSLEEDLPPYYDDNDSVTDRVTLVDSKGVMDTNELTNSDMILQDAMLNYKCALDISCSHKGSSNPQSIKVAARIGQLFYLLNDFSAALREFQHCRKLTQYLDPSYAGFLGGLGIAIANILSRGSDIQQKRAMTLYTASLTVVSRMFGADSLSICAAYTGIGNIWFARGDFAAALRHFLAGESIARKSLGEADRFRLYLMQNIAISYLKLGDPQKTLNYLKKIEEIMKKIESKEIKMKYIAKLHWNVTSLLSYWGKSAPDVKVLKELKAVALRNVSAFRRFKVAERRY
jgi:tetratricopeptide (TPR) repeat protein